MLIEKNNKWLSDNKAVLTTVDAYMDGTLKRNADIAGIQDASGLINNIICVSSVDGDSSIYMKKDATSSNTENWVEWTVFDVSLGR